MPDFKKVWEDFLTYSPGSTADVRVFFAPGRVNLIGEHIDYNGGLVMPAALTIGTWLFLRKRSDGTSRFASQAFPSVSTTHVSAIKKGTQGDFSDYMKGIYHAFAHHGSKHSPAADFYFVSNLPNQAGLSSSAAVELATAYALNTLGHLGYSTLDLVRLSQEAENEFVGVNCGIMDQFAVGMGKASHAMLLNTSNLDYEYIPAEMGQYLLVITNTNKKRQLSDSKYNERRQECETALSKLQVHFPSMIHLVENGEVATKLDHYLNDEVLIRRTRHVMTENKRVMDATSALKNRKMVDFGKLLNASHESLRDDYEVTGKELDALVEAQWHAPGCIGARMTGAGFGGCTVGLVHEDAVADFQAQVEQEYRQATGLTPSFYVSDIGEGVREVTKEVHL